MAIKAINTDRLNSRLQENLTAEIQAMKDFRSPHIVELYDLQRSGQFIYLVLEYCAGGDLAGLLRRQDVLEEEQVRRLIRQLAEALRLLVGANYAHRDLKPQNLLLAADGTLKLGDFGFVRFVDPADMAETLCGSPLYMAPEILRYERYDGKADLWSVGAIMYEMLFGRPPFRAQNHIQLLRVIEQAPRIAFPKTVYLPEHRPRPRAVRVSERCRDLILGLLQKNPDERLSFDALITHPFFDAPVAPAPPGFALPKAIAARPRSGSLQPAPTPLSFHNVKRPSSLAASLRQASSLQTAAALPAPAPASPAAAAREAFPEEERLAQLVLPLAGPRPGLLRLVQRDARLALVLRDMADSSAARLDRSEESLAGRRKGLLATGELLLLAGELLQGLLLAIKAGGPADFRPADDAPRGLVLWLAARLRECTERTLALQRQLDEPARPAHMAMSITSSASSAEAPTSVSELLYGYALKCVRARAGGRSHAVCVCV